MLKHVVDRSVVAKKIMIATGCEALTEFLTILAGHWKFEICEIPAADVLLLAEEGCAKPIDGQMVIWLTRSKYQGTDRLSLPLEIENFWQTLELRFHRPPRKHIRMEVDMVASVSIDDETVSATLSSLSDMGCRFLYHRELVRDQQAFITLSVDGQDLRIDSRVIYAMPQPSSSKVRVGLIFRGIEKGQRDSLRAYLIGRYLEKVKNEMVGERFLQALENFSLPEVVRQKLSH